MRYFNRCKIYYVTLFITLCSLLKAQAPDTLWSKTIGGIYDDYASCVQQTSDNGYIITGRTYSSSGGPEYCDIYIIKTDSQGNVIWTKTYGDTLNDLGNSVRQCDSDEIIVVGTTLDPITGETYAYMIKTDSMGDSLWTRTYTFGYNTYANSLQLDSDTGYVICGTAAQDIYIAKTDSAGNISWGNTYGGGGFEEGNWHQTDIGSGYIITGATTSFGAGGADVYLLKTGMHGDTLWSRTYGGSQDDWGNVVKVTSDNGYIIVGSTASFGLSYQILLIKTNAIGDTVWMRTYGGSGTELGLSVLAKSNGDFVVVGVTNSYGAGARDIYLIKIDAFGDIIWSTTFGGPDDDVGKSIEETNDSGYIITGYTRSFGTGEHDVWLLKTQPDTLGIQKEESICPERHNLVPTVFSGPLSLPEDKNYQIFDITGRNVEQEKIKPGVYFIEIDGIILQKVVKIR